MRSPAATPFAVASVLALALHLLPSPDAAAQLPGTLDGYYPVPIAGEPLTIGGTGTIAPGGATLEFFYSPLGINVANLNVDYLVVGGGGGGGTSTNFGGAGSGGGGGGGVVTGSASLGTGPVDVVIGSGGTPGGLGNNSGSNGASSFLDSIEALGGGGGIGGNGAGLAGGSGGGGRGGDGGAALQPVSSSGGFGSPGGGGGATLGTGGGGGGGADPLTGTGGGTSAVGGSGGDGLLSAINGVPARYGAGGGGGASGTSTIGFGGLGGGGNGANNNTAATSGLLNSGSGGGGGNNNRQGATGGSGIVIVSHTGGPGAASGGTVTTSGGTTIHTFTADNLADNNRVNITADVDGSGDITLIGDRMSPTATTLVELSGNNSGFTGNLILDDIHLRVTNGTALGASGAGTIINPGSTLDINGQNLQTQAITLAGGTITNTGAGQQDALRFVTVTADSTFTGTGRWDIRGANDGNRGLLATNGNTIAKTSGNKIALVHLDITGGGTINVSGGVLGLTRSYMDSGTINVSNGARLEFENNSPGQFSYGMDMSLSNGRIDVRGNSITTSGNLVLTGGDTSNTIDPSGGLVYQLTGNISGSGGFQKIGSGILVLSGNNTHSGNTRLNAGLLSATNTSAFGSGTVIANGGTLALLNNGAGNDGTIVYGNNFLTNSNNTATILVGNNGQNTGNTIVIANNDYNMGTATLNVEGMNDYNLRIENFRLGGGGAGTSVVNPTSANLIIGNVNNSNANHTLELGGTSQGNLIDGNISQGGQIVSINKTNSSTWTLAGNNNTHSGPTTVTDGTLNIAGVIQNSPVSVLSDGRLTGAGTINSSLAVNGGTLAPGDPNLFGLGTMTVNGPINFASTWEVNILGPEASLLSHSGSFNGSLEDITLAAGDTFSPQTFVPYLIYQGDSQDPLQGLFENFSPGGFGSLAGATGTGELNGTLFAAFVNSTLDGQGNLVSGNGIVLYAIPEPGRATLATLGLLALLARRRRA